ncbi:hypothetical protein, partial [Chitinimonas sp. BJB300]|uniref:hypothetical protein n=1 Tax=Chitinimonas sp. BJB300 TaxID=1559339 RepID=UPI000C104670
MAQPRTLEQIRAQNPQLAQLDDQTIMVGIYNRDFAGTMTPQQYMAATGYTPKASGMDYVKSAAAGAGDLVAAAGYGLQKLGADGLGGAIRDAGQTAQRYWADDMTGAGRSVANNPIVTDDYALGDTPLQSTLMAASRSVPGMVATAPVGGIVGLAAKSGLGRLAVTKGAQAAAEAGSATLAQKALLAAPGAIGMGVAEGGQAALVNAEQTHAKIMDLTATPEEALLQNPTYRANLQQTRDPLAARQAVADETANQVLRNTMLATGGIGILTGGGALGSVFNRVTGKPASALASQGAMGLAKSAAMDIGKEAGQEFLQSGAEQYIQNAAERDHIDPSKDAWRGVGPAALSGAAVGGLMGGGTHVLGKPFEQAGMPALNRNPAPAIAPAANPITETAQLPALYQPGGEYLPANEATLTPERQDAPPAPQFNVTPDGVAIPVPREVRALPDRSGTLYANQFGVASEQMADVAPNEQVANEIAAHTQRREGALRVIGKIQERASTLQGDALAQYQANSAPALARAQQAWQESDVALAQLGQKQSSPAHYEESPQGVEATTDASSSPRDVAPGEIATTADIEPLRQTPPAKAPRKKPLPVAKPLDMSDAELAERASYIQEQAKRTQGWTTMLAAGMREVRNEQQKRAKSARQADLFKHADKKAEVVPSPVEKATPKEQPVKWFTTVERATAFIDKKKLTDTHAPVAVEKLAPNGKHVTVYEIHPKPALPVKKTAEPAPVEAEADETAAIEASEPAAPLDKLPAPIEQPAAEAAKPPSTKARQQPQQRKQPEDSNESNEVSADGQGTLVHVSTAEGSRTESRGDARGVVADRSDTSPSGSRQSDGTGLAEARSRGSRAGELHPAEAGTGRGPAGLGGNRTGGKRARVPAHDAQSRLADPVETPQIPLGNFRITDEVKLGKGGEAEKFRDNLAAIRVVRALEQERRRATSDEQRTLARYVGWGGLANAFADPDGNFKAGWEQKGTELAELLTKDELAAARSSTRNAHYTSETVVSAMWAAAAQLGFKGGLALEPSVGTGNFLGLIPDALAGATRFVGVEYDSLTARIAQALYPRETILHTGFQKVPFTEGEFDLAIGNPPFGKDKLNFRFRPELNGATIHNQFFRGSMAAVRPGGLQIMVVSRYLMDAHDGSSRAALAQQARLLGAIRLPQTAFKENARTDVVTDIIFLQRLNEAEAAEMADAFAARDTRSGKWQGNSLPGETAEDARKRLAGLVPDWVDTTPVADPLGGEPITVNRYFAQQPDMIVGTLDRSGKQNFQNDVTVRIDKGADMAALLQERIAKLPRDVMLQKPDAIANSLARHKTMTDALVIALAGHEYGHVELSLDGQLQRIIERETPSGDWELAKLPLNADSPWSDQLLMNAQGKWYRTVPKLDEAGKALKEIKNGKPTNRNLYDREVFDNEAEIPAGLRLGETGFERLKLLVGLRDALKQQLSMEAKDESSKQLESNRKKLAALYRDYVAQHGLVNLPSNAKYLNDMPDGALVLALEQQYQPPLSKGRAEKLGESPRAASAQPATILKQRAIPKYEPVKSAATPADALVVSLAESGKVDMARVAALLGMSEEAAIANLQEGATPLVFMDPETRRWETRDAYLTGEVKRKLRAAQTLGMQANVKALEAVQPEPWGSENVVAFIGSTWVPPEIYGEFVSHLSGQAAKVRYSKLTNSFSVDAAINPASEWNTEGLSAPQIVNELLNGNSIKVYDPPASKKESRKLNQEKTDAALAKAAEIKAEFEEWIFKDAERRRELVQLFNDRFNTRVAKQHDGSHLMLPGKVPDAIITLRRHQKNAVWRGISERFMLLDHCVGAGKTFTAIARAMERRRMGLSNKPMIVVPNHMIEQFAADTYRLYPGAKVLAASKKDFESKRRRRLFAKIATGDWDIVIVAHSSFGFIGIDPDTEQRYLEAELREAEAAIKEAEAQATEDGYSGHRKSFNVKEAERLRDKLTTRMEGIMHRRRDKLLTFEQMGVDDLTVDEAHEFKNLFYSSRMTGVKGMGNKAGSGKAVDLYNKVRVLRDSPTGTVTFMTGTPISNSVVEMYTVMRYLAEQELNEFGIAHFDAWRNQFVETASAFEPDEAGRLVEVNRLGRSWSNMRGLMELYYSFTDAVSLEDIQQWFSKDNKGQAFPVPKVKGGERQSIVVQPSAAQVAILNEVLNGFNGLADIKDPNKRNAERLRLMDRARKLSLDARVVDASLSSKEEGGKLQRVSEETFRIYQASNQDKGTQLIFLDRSIPKGKGDGQQIKTYDELVAKRERAIAAGDEGAYQSVNDALEKYDPAEMEEIRRAQVGGWNAYQQIKDNLVALGVPAREIRFIQEANNDADKQALFDEVKVGRVRILLGSTPRMGAGTNVQDRLVALHHVDVTWKPSDIEQREGRIIRQGNKLYDKYGPDFAVEILAYVTERTMDAKMWALNATKLKAINGIRKYDGSFSMDFDDSDALGMAEIAAVASGDPMLLERVQISSEIDKLERLRKAHNRRQSGLRDSRDAAQRTIDKAPQKIKQIRADGQAYAAAQQLAEQWAAERELTIEGKSYSDRFEAEQAFQNAVSKQQAGNEKARYSVRVAGEKVTNRAKFDELMDQGIGDDAAIVMEMDGQTYHTRLEAARHIAMKGNALLSELKVSATEVVGKVLGLPLEMDIQSSAWEENHVRMVLAVVGPDGRTLAVKTGDYERRTEFASSYVRNLLSAVTKQLLTADTEHNVQKVDDEVKHAQDTLAQLAGQLDKPFAKQGELTQKKDRLNEVESLLSGKGEAADPQAATEATTEQPAEAGPIVFSRSDAHRPGSEGSDATLLRKQFAPLIARWKNAPHITIVQSVQDLPVRYLDKLRSQNAEGDVEGFFDQKANAVYLVADRLADTPRALHVLVHEVLGHAGLRGLFGKQLNPLLASIYRGHGNVREAADGLVDRYGYDKFLAVEEVLADMALRASLTKQAFWPRIVTAIRNLIRRYGFVRQWTDNDIVALLGSARRYVTEAPTAGKDTGRTDGKPLATSRKDGPAQRMAMAWKLLAQADELFRFPRPQSFDLADIAAEIDPGLSVVVDQKAYSKAERDEQKIAQVWKMTMADRKEAWIIENQTGEVWIDASSLTKGISGGGKLYAAVASYAAANGKVFIGDPAGLSEAALVRRTEQMLSSALKEGMTQHLMPHARQMDPDSYQPNAKINDAIRPITWVPGDDAHNLLELLKTSYHNVRQLVPDVAKELNHVSYSFEKGRFETDGEPVDDKYFQELAGRAALELQRHGFPGLVSGRASDSGQPQAWA